MGTPVVPFCYLLQLVCDSARGGQPVTSIGVTGGVDIEYLQFGQLFMLSGAGFMNRRRLCQLTAAILTSDLTTHLWGF